MQGEIIAKMIITKKIMMEERISSLQNPLVKQLLRLQQKSAERRRSGLFAAEGRREVSLALAGGFEAEQLLLCPDIYQEDPAYPIAPPPGSAREVSRTVYNRLAWRSDAEGVILLGKQKQHSLSGLKLPRHPLILLLEGIEKPGNLGAILRTADAAGADALILADPKTDLYNPNTIRSSLGCAFTVPSAVCSSQEALDWISHSNEWQEAGAPRLILASLQASRHYFETDMSGGIVLAFGAEDKGLTPAFRETAHQSIRIPMAGAIDSLNLSASVAVLCFEAVRQRLKA